ncbi:glycosyltransferase family 4 protein [Zobellella iuensis]|uniref:Glycosyltransferase family 4 protein n=1 Tax=Zobellella iuensis TaxID=2803811 RepID=A0ABS1QNX1_9GAMM|nr:glycosyltransferase family 4 protein [Zobellella iuensis]MBL1376557.1 glycosyltransferase family 4 protein [Zobellella iuensis]
MSNRMLCIHQGAELYGSDRSFLAAVEALSGAKKNVDVILPCDGELARKLVELDRVSISFYKKGVLRRRELMRPFKFMFDCLSGFWFYTRLFRNYPVVYINTVVMFSALLAATLYRFSSRRMICHVREIPTGLQLIMFRALLSASGAELVFNSNATRSAFNLPGAVIYNGVEEYDDGGCHKSNSTETGRVAQNVNLLIIGRVNEWKGQSFFIESLAQLSCELKECFSVRVVGSPFQGYEYLLDNLKSLIEKNGLEKIVSLYPFCSDTEVHYQWADYVIVPSTKPEPFGRVAIEAFSFRKPVIAAAHGGLLEIIDNTVNGFLFSPNETSSLKSTLSSLPTLCQNQYEEMSSMAYSKFKECFSVDSYRNNIVSLFNG